MKRCSTEGVLAPGRIQPRALLFNEYLHVTVGWRLDLPISMACKLDDIWGEEFFFNLLNAQKLGLWYDMKLGYDNPCL